MSEPRYFVVYNIDAPGTAELRLRLRPEHMAFMKSLPQARVGGPLLAQDGETRNGGMYVVEAASLEEAAGIAGRDPYVQAGLFESSQIREWRWQTRNL